MAGQVSDTVQEILDRIARLGESDRETLLHVLAGRYPRLDNQRQDLWDDWDDGEVDRLYEETHSPT